SSADPSPTPSGSSSADPSPTPSGSSSADPSPTPWVPLTELLPEIPPTEIAEIIQEALTCSTLTRDVKAVFARTLLIREQYVKAADYDEVTPELAATLRAAIDEENAVVAARDTQCEPTITRIASLRTDAKWSSNESKALAQIESVVVAQDVVSSEFISLQRTSFSEEIPDFAMKDAIIVWSIIILALFAGWWIIIVFRRKRVWIDDEVCTRCDVCVLKDPEIFQRNKKLNVVRINGSSFDVRKKNDEIEDYPDRIDEAVEACEPEAMRSTRFVPRRIKKQDETDEKK
ncbi:MAG: hypothetical protein RL723_1231, partial [Actinomycetota bacterium]